jgi:hypothetical protein
LHNTLVKLTETLNRFLSGEVQYFDAHETPSLQGAFDKYLNSVEKDMAELRFLKLCLQQRIEMFDNLRSKVKIGLEVCWLAVLRRI